MVESSRGWTSREVNLVRPPPGPFDPPRSLPRLLPPALLPPSPPAPTPPSHSTTNARARLRARTNAQAVHAQLAPDRRSGMNPQALVLRSLVLRSGRGGEGHPGQPGLPRRKGPARACAQGGASASSQHVSRRLARLCGPVLQGAAVLGAVGRRAGPHHARGVGLIRVRRL